MKLLDSTASIREAALSYPHPAVRTLLSERIKQLEGYEGYEIGELARFLIVEPGDAAHAVETAFGLDFMTDIDGHRYGRDDDYVPPAEWIQCHANGLYEALIITDDSGFGHVLVVASICMR